MRWFIMKVHTRRGRRGFSLTEMLLVVGLIAILLTVAVPSVIYYQRELKLTELDDNARSVFVAAQNHLTALRSASAGELELGAAVGREAVAVPSGATPAGTELKYVSTDVVGAEPGWLVLPGSIEADLAEGCYLVEFEPKSGSVYGVFYLERDGRVLDESTYEDIYQYSDGGKTCRTRDGRKAFLGSVGGFYVGYYGANGALDVDRPDAQALPQPKLKLINAEELRVEIEAESWPTGIEADKVYTSVTVSGGGATKNLVTEGAIRSGVTNTVVLDTLKTSGYNTNAAQPTAGWTVGAPFAQWMGGGGGYTITPGADITVTVSVFYKPDSGEGVVALPQSASVTTNSLFAARSGETVDVRYGRHLQNLDANTSHLDSAITAAKQIRAIDFAQPGAAPYSWESTYGQETLPFVPIDNEKLESYDGGSLTIQNLYAVKAGADYENAGLFGTFQGSELKNVKLVDARVRGSQSGGTLAGALVGASSSRPVTVSGCQIYITDLREDPPKVWGGRYAGGLVGQAGNAVITDGSFAATTVYGSQTATTTTGGLVGYSNGNLTVQNSYAAGHMTGGTNVAGLVGGGTGITIQDSYAAGTILKATGRAGGLSTGSATVRRSYAAVEYVEVPAAENVYGLVPSGSCQSAYYLVKLGVNDAVTVNNVTAVTSSELMRMDQGLTLGSSFAEGGDASVMAVPYHLPNQTDGTREPALSAPYPYPTLALDAGDGEKTALTHYGDWLVATPQTPKSLIAYYEQFDGVTEYSSYVGGVEEGQIKDSTRTGAINAEGYAFLSEKKLHNDWEDKVNLTVTAVGAETRETAVQGRLLGTLDEELNETADEALIVYYVYAIPTTSLDVVPSSKGYSEVTVKGTAPQIQWGVPPEEVETTAWVTTFFGRAAYNGAQPTTIPDPIHIRSLRHLANVGRFFGARGYVQDLDIDASVYCGDLAFDRNGNSIGQEGRALNDAGHVTVAGFEVWGQNWDKSWDYATNLWSMPATYRLLFTPIGQHDSPDGVEGGYDKVTSFNGVYDGNGRTIRALSIRSYYYAEDKADYTGLFYRVISGTLEDVHLSDCDVIGATGGSSNATGALAGRLSSGSRAINCTVKDCTILAQGTKAGGHVGGLVGYADNGSLVVSGCSVENSMVDGGAYSHNAGGLVGYIYKLTPDKSTGSGGVFQNCTVKDVETKIGFTGKDNVTNVSKLGTAAGFVGCFQDSTGLLERCTVIGTGGFGVSGNTWGTGGFAGIISNKAGVSIQDCGVRLEGSVKSSYAAQSVSGGRVGGGFVGMLSGTGSIQSSYAAVKVDGTTAGGFTGTLEGGSLSNCYAGGHTQSGAYSAGRANVTGTDFSGGLIGLWKDGEVSACYTTCAVTGTKELAVDVFANQETAVMGNSTAGCYALGAAFVNGGKRGSLTKTNVPVTMTKLAEEARTQANPYDTALPTKYPYTPVTGTDGAPMPHYGDWPDAGSHGSRFEWTPRPQEFTSVDHPYLDASMDWNGNDLTFTFITKGDGSNLANQFAPSGGHFAITTDLGYVMVFQAVSNGDGSTSIYMEGGEKLCDIVPVEQGYGDDRLRTYEFTIPTASLPPYLETINLGGFQEGYVIDGIKNRDPSASDYKPDDPFLPGDMVDIDGDFSDWDGYAHQLLTHTPGNALTDGHVVGSSFGKGNVIYLHVINEYKPNLVEPGYSGNLEKVPVTNFSIQVKGDDAWDSHNVEWWRFTGQSYTGPGIYKLEMDQYSADWSTFLGVSVKLEAYLEIREDGSQETEMAIYLDEIAGKETADKITEVTVNYGTIGGSLTVWRDPPETEE